MNFRAHYVISKNISGQDLSISVYIHAIINHSQRLQYIICLNKGKAKHCRHENLFSDLKKLESTGNTLTVTE